MRRNVGAYLEDDLVAVMQDDRRGDPAAADPIHVHTHGTAEREQARRSEGLSPHVEDVTDRGTTGEVNDAGGIEGPEAGAATCGFDAAERLPRAAKPDRRRHDHDAAVGKQLHVRSLATGERRGRAGRVHRRPGVVLRSDADRCRRERKHWLHGIALLTLLGLAGCGGSSGSPTIAIQPARQFQLTTHIVGTPTAGSPATIAYFIQRPDGSRLTRFRQGPGPHTGVHVIYIRNDLGGIVHHHPPIAADGSFKDTVTFPSGGPYRVVIDVYPRQATQPNFQLFTRIQVKGPYTPKPLPPLALTQDVRGYRFTLHGKPRLHAIQPAFLSFTVTRPDGTPAQFSPWYGALAHAIFFRAGTLDYFHTHVCAPGASGCTSAFGGAKVTGTSATPGKLSVGVLVPVAGTWRLFLQCLVDRHVLTASFTLQVR
jgi:hypothetical protein